MMKGSKLAKFGGLPGKLEVAGEVGSSKTTKYSNYTHRHTGIVVGKNIRGQPLCKSSFVLQNGRYLLFCLFTCSQRTDRRKQAAIFSFRPKKKTKIMREVNSYNKTVHILFDVFLTRLPQKWKTTKQKRYFQEKNYWSERMH